MMALLAFSSAFFGDHWPYWHVIQNESKNLYINIYPVSSSVDCGLIGMPVGGVNWRMTFVLLRGALVAMFHSLGGFCLH